MQYVDRVADVQPLSKPAGRRCLCVDVNIVSEVPLAKLRNRIGRYGRSCWAFGEDRAVGTPETELAIWLSLDVRTILVYPAEVPTAQRGGIERGRRAAMRPMGNMMTLAKRRAAAREATSLIAMFKRTP